MSSPLEPTRHLLALGRREPALKGSSATNEGYQIGDGPLYIFKCCGKHFAILITGIRAVYVGTCLAWEFACQRVPPRVAAEHNGRC